MIEMVISVALLAIVVAKLAIVMSTSSETFEDHAATMDLENRAQQVMDQIVLQIMSADSSSLVPSPASPDESDELTFNVSLGVRDGEVVYSPPQRIEMADGGGAVTWSENPGAVDERRVVWCNIARPFFDGELPNAVDDNGNGLIDEHGLSFEIQGRKVTIRLTLEREGPAGELIQTIQEAEATCRM